MIQHILEILTFYAQCFRLSIFLLRKFYTQIVVIQNKLINTFAL